MTEDYRLSMEYDSATVQKLIDFFGSYAAAVAQTRALVSVEDGLKRGLRQAIYTNYKDGFRHNKPYSKGLRLVSSGQQVYWHGESSLYDTIMRSGKRFITNIPLYDIDSGEGDLTENKSHPQMRYSELRLSPLAEVMLSSVEEGAVKEWLTGYDDVYEYPNYLPTLGFWNVVNGSSGIGVGLASSIPPFNLVELNEYLLKILWEKETELPLPDFPVGSTIINKKEVLESLQRGYGGSAKIRANITYDDREHSLVITELPYLVFSNDVHSQIQDLIFGKKGEEEGHINPGISHVHDATSMESKIEVFLEKDASPTQIRELLYRETSAESFYPINLTMLVDGRYPEVMTFEKAAKYFLAAQQDTVRRVYEFRKAKTEHQILIKEALIKVSVDIDNVVQIIKTSRNRSEAASRLAARYFFNDAQVKAILAFTLGKLTGLELEALKREKQELEETLKEIIFILSSEEEIKKIVDQKLQEVAKKFGKPRKTKVTDLSDDSNGLIYFNKRGQATTVVNPKRADVGSAPIGARYFGITNTGFLLTGTQAPERMRKVFSIQKGEEIVGVGGSTTGKVINILLDNGRMLYLDTDEERRPRRRITSRTPIAVEVSDRRATKRTMKI